MFGSFRCDIFIDLYKHFRQIFKVKKSSLLVTKKNLVMVKRYIMAGNREDCKSITEIVNECNDYCDGSKPCSHNYLSYY